MALPQPEPGLVIRYAYLWLDEFNEGREEGGKDRPCAIVAAISDEGGTKRVLCLPVTHRAPSRPEYAVEIPPAVKRHLGLDDARSWIIVDEHNEFIWPGPDLRRARDGDDGTVAYGFLPPGLFAQVRKLFLSLDPQRGTRSVKRTQ